MNGNACFAKKTSATKEAVAKSSATISHFIFKDFKGSALFVKIADLEPCCFCFYTTGVNNKQHLCYSIHLKCVYHLLYLWCTGNRQWQGCNDLGTAKLLELRDMCLFLHICAVLAYMFKIPGGFHKLHQSL